jgi:hypothetical protein
MNEDAYVFLKELLERHERGTKERHLEAMKEVAEIKGTLKGLDARMRSLELQHAAAQPVVKGATSVFVMLCGALVAGYVGSLFGG